MNAQLFDALVNRHNLRNNKPAQVKKADNTHNDQIVANKNKPNSLFENFYQKSEAKINKKASNTVKSLFGEQAEKAEGKKSYI